MIKNLILSSGGVNGYFFVGGLKYLVEHNLLDNLENILGTSAGSLFGFLYLLGFAIYEIEELVTKMTPDSLLNITGESVLTFLDDFGIDNGERFEKIMKIVAYRKINNPNVTFKQLFEKTNITFTISVLNLNKRKLVYFSHLNYPDLEVYKAIRMSSSIPILFKPVLFEGDLHLDGGAQDPCSLTYFKNPKQTLGLMISSNSEIKEINNIQDYLVTLMCSPIYKVSENYFDKPNVIIYDCKNNEGLNFEIKNDKISELIKLGYEITKEEIEDILEYFKRTSH